MAEDIVTLDVPIEERQSAADVVGAPAPEPPLYEDDEQQIVLADDAPAIDAEKEALRSELAAKQAALEKAQGAPVDAIAAGLKGLQESLRAPAPAANAPASFDLDSFVAEKDKDFFDKSPTRTVLELMDRFAGAQNSEMAKLNLSYSKQFLLTDPKDKAVYERFAKEVDEEVTKRPAADQAKRIDVYRDALAVVKGRHFDELVAEAAAKAPVAPARPASYSETGAVRAPAAVAKASVSIKRSDLGAVRDFANTYGISEGDAARVMIDRGLISKA